MHIGEALKDLEQFDRIIYRRGWTNKQKCLLLSAGKLSVMYKTKQGAWALSVYVIQTADLKAIDWQAQKVSKGNLTDEKRREIEEILGARYR